MSSKINYDLRWNLIGGALSMVSNLYSIVRDKFTEMGIGLDILEWVVNEGRDFFVEEILTPLANRFEVYKNRLFNFIGVNAITEQGFNEYMGTIIKDGIRNVPEHISLELSDEFIEDFSDVNTAEIPWKSGKQQFDMYDSRQELKTMGTVPASVMEYNPISYIWIVLFLVKNQLADKHGALNQSKKNVFYIANKHGQCRVVCVRLHSSHGYIHSARIDGDCSIEEGSRLFKFKKIEGDL